MHFNMEKEALRASDLEDEEHIELYRGKLHSLFLKFKTERKPSGDLLSTASLLFDWLWKGRRNRYQPKGEYRLHKVIDAQINKADKPVGNCLGLTILYNCLMERAGVTARTIFMENAFDMGPHVLTVIKKDNRIIAVENIFKSGFDYKGHPDSLTGTKWGDQELVADIYNSRGNEFFEKDAFHEALIQYKKAVVLNPQYETACLNKAIVLQKLS